jgi:hypothetical protein
MCSVRHCIIEVYINVRIAHSNLVRVYAGTMCAKNMSVYNVDNTLYSISRIIINFSKCASFSHLEVKSILKNAKKTVFHYNFVIY